MTTYDIKRLALVLAIQAEIEGMKADNKLREQNGICLAWDVQSFDYKANELRNIAAIHDEQL